MDSETKLYRVLNKDKDFIYVIANSPTQAIDLAALPRPNTKAHIEANEAVVVSEQSYDNNSLKLLLGTNEIGEIIYDLDSKNWFWAAPFYILEFKYHGPFNSNEAAAQYALNSNIPQSSRVLRINQ